MPENRPLFRGCKRQIAIARRGRNALSRLIRDTLEGITTTSDRLYVDKARAGMYVEVNGLLHLMNHRICTYACSIPTSACVLLGGGLFLVPGCILNASLVDEQGSVERRHSFPCYSGEPRGQGNPA